MDAFYGRLAVNDPQPIPPKRPTPAFIPVAHGQAPGDRRIYPPPAAVSSQQRPTPAIIPTARALDYFSPTDRPKMPAQLLVLGWVGLAYGCLRIWWNLRSIALLIAVLSAGSTPHVTNVQRWLYAIFVVTSILLSIGLVSGSILCLKRKPAAHRLMLIIAVGSIALFAFNNWWLIQPNGFAALIAAISRSPARLLSWLFSLGFPIWTLIALYRPAVKRALAPQQSLDAHGQPMEYVWAENASKIPIQLLALGWVGLVYGCLRIVWVGSLIKGILGPDDNWASSMETHYCSSWRPTWLLIRAVIVYVPVAFGLLVGSIMCLKQSPAARRFMLTIAMVSIAVPGIYVLDAGPRLLAMIAGGGLPEFLNDPEQWAKLFFPCGFAIWGIITMFNPAVRQALA